MMNIALVQRKEKRNNDSFQTEFIALSRPYSVLFIFNYYIGNIKKNKYGKGCCWWNFLKSKQNEKENRWQKAFLTQKVNGIWRNAPKYPPINISKGMIYSCIPHRTHIYVVSRTYFAVFFSYLILHLGREVKRRKIRKKRKKG